MNTLKDHVIVYDHECPMCNLYTGAFTHMGWLDENGRITYSTLETLPACQWVDKDRARNEIALIDKQTGQVRYGIESMLHIVGNRLPLLQPLFRNRIFLAVMKRFYSLISYNRKVMAPSSRETETSCVPDFNLKYRFLYIMIALYTVLFFGWQTGKSLPAPYEFAVITVIAGWWVINSIFSIALLRKEAVVYLGHLVTVLLVGSLLMLPSLLGKALTGQLPLWFLALNSVLSIGVMTWQYVRRVRLLKLSVRWVAGSVAGILVLLDIITGS